MKAFTLAALTLFSLQATATGGSQQKQQNLSGVYWTPVPAELAEFAVFSVPEVKVRTFDDKVKIAYDLPLELTGNLNRIELEGPTDTNGPVVLTGPNGHAECPDAKDYSSCKLFYTELDINTTARTELLKQIAKTPVELAMRELVAARFCAASSGGEPCGFLKVINYKPAKAQKKY